MESTPVTRESFRNLRVLVSDSSLYTGAMQGMDLVCEATAGQLENEKYNWQILLSNNLKYKLKFLNASYIAVADTLNKMRARMTDIVCACISKATPQTYSKRLPVELWGER